MRKLIKSEKPEGLIVIQKGKIFVFVSGSPRDYVWDLKHGTKAEKDYLLRCLNKNRWLPE